MYRKLIRNNDNNNNVTKTIDDNNNNNNVLTMFLEISEFGGALLGVALTFYLIVLILKSCFHDSHFTRKYVIYFEILTYTVSWYAISICFGLYNKLVFSKTKLNFPLLLSSCHMFLKGFFLLIIVSISKCIRSNNRAVDNNNNTFEIVFPSLKVLSLYIVPIGIFTGVSYIIINTIIYITTNTRDLLIRNILYYNIIYIYILYIYYSFIHHIYIYYI